MLSNFICIKLKSMSWLQDLIHMKQCVDKSIWRIWYYKKELDRLEKNYDKNADENMKKEQSDKIVEVQKDHDNEKVELSKFEEKYMNTLQKYEKAGIVSSIMIEEIIKRSKNIKGIQNEINMLGDSKYDLEEKQKEQMDEIKERYNRIYTNNLK